LLDYLSRIYQKNLSDHFQTNSLAQRFAQRAARARFLRVMQQQQQHQEAELKASWWHKLRWRPTSHAEALVDEQHLLKLAECELEARDISFGTGRHEYLHTIIGGKTNESSSPKLVYVPGYGAGSGFLFRAMQAITAGFHMFAVDPLGTGLSGRPRFTAKTTAEAEAFFINSLEKWREAAGIEKMVLMGHSMGGYVSAAYALKYPERVQHLIMVCPAGVGRRPEDWTLPEQLRSPWSFKGQLYRMAVAAWNSGITPGAMVRAGGPLGKKIVEGYTRNRFKRQGHHLNEEEVSAFEKYMYHVVAAPGSGEFALNKILEPFAYPRAPLENRMHELKVPVTFIYGSNDWMDPKAAARVCASLENETTRVATNGQNVLTAQDRKVLFTPNAGHYPYIDQPGAFIENLIEACEDYLPKDAVERMKIAAQRHPFIPGPDAAMDTKEELDKEMKENPAAAEARIATDM
jgi:abhydrolase domain-containing protein 5